MVMHLLTPIVNFCCEKQRKKKCVLKKKKKTKTPNTGVERERETYRERHTQMEKKITSYEGLELSWIRWLNS